MLVAEFPPRQDFGAADFALWVWRLLGRRRVTDRLGNCLARGVAVPPFWPPGFPPRIHRVSLEHISEH